ncbi:uncharacterized protein GGS22DRAFT_174535 [Annulohypoxylon maeteangense]|uniref:uncharacterized protein n=1 Tax=Annulohypoxylon maeteangense TaxID=1927788 RepID=UPI00200892E6|nr:uncharacterized protein GGS22DRAFT_174535 [Annulohypoxylon maeteangense]KAI0880691.1 hypothetical protein GGS22DRAFT_174535 [Annulohypoxylon maeteangense]
MGIFFFFKKFFFFASSFLLFLLFYYVPTIDVFLYSFSHLTPLSLLYTPLLTPILTLTLNHAPVILLRESSPNSPFLELIERNRKAQERKEKKAPTLLYHSCYYASIRRIVIRWSYMHCIVEKVLIVISRRQPQPSKPVQDTTVLKRPLFYYLNLDNPDNFGYLDYLDLPGPSCYHI